MSLLLVASCIFPVLENADFFSVLTLLLHLLSTILIANARVKWSIFFHLKEGQQCVASPHAHQSGKKKGSYNHKQHQGKSFF